MLGIAVLLLFGCGKQEKMKVYIVEEDALYESAILKYVQENPKTQIEVEYFQTYDEVNDRLKTELLSGGGPDVILFNSFYSKEDIYKLATSGSLLELDHMIEDLSDEEYYKKILNAGILNDNQYFLPLSWNVLQAYSKQETKNENIYDTFVQKEDDIKNLDGVGLTSLQLLRSDWMNVFFEAMGVQIFDVQTGEVLADKDEVLNALEFTKIIYDDTAKRKEITGKYSQDFAGAVSHLEFLTENFSFLHNIRYYETVYPVYTGKEMNVSIFSNQGNDGITAQIVQYGAINANTEYVEEAWAFLKYILDMPVTMSFEKYDMNTAYYAPVKKETYQDCVDVLNKQAGPGPSMKVGPLSDEYANWLNEVPEQVSNAKIPNVVYGAMLQECLVPYLKGEEDFETCYSTLVQKTKLYLSE